MEMEVAVRNPGKAAPWILGICAAVSAMALAAMNYEPSASGYASWCLAPLVLGIFSLLVYAQPGVTFILALLFITSPLRLTITQPQSAVITMFLLCAAAVGFALRTGWRALAPDPLLLPVGIFAAYGMASMVHGWLAGNELSYVLGDGFQITEFALVYFLVAQLFRSRTAIQILLRAALLAILITVVAELALFALGPLAGGLLPSWEGGAAAEQMLRTIDIDATILFTVLINLYPMTRTPGQRCLLWAALIPTVANIALSLSRGLWVCTLAAGAVSLVLQERKTRALLLRASAWVGVSVALLAAGWKVGSGRGDSLMDVFEERVFHGVDQVEEGFAGTESMATRRFLEVAIVAPQVLAQPWFGRGLGATYIIGGFAVLDAGTSGLIDHHFIHNLYLATSFRMGLVGLGLLFWVLGRYFRRILRAYGKLPANFSKAIVAGLVASVVGQLFLSMSEPTVLDHPTCVLIATAMAVSFRLAPASTGQLERVAAGV